MKLQYKILVVIACFFVFYMLIIPIGLSCMIPADGCTLLWELVRHVVLTVPSDGGIVEYSGTVQGMEEPSVENFIRQNTSFLVIMVFIPTCIIGAITFHDRHKIRS